MPSINPELEILIKAQTDRAVREVNQLNNTLEVTHKKLEKMNAAAKNQRLLNSLSNIGNASRKMAQTIALPTIALGAAAIKAAAGFERQRTELEVLLGSAEKGAQLFQQLKQFAAATPLQLTDIQTVTQNLLAFGVSAEEIIPTLQTLGDVSRGNNAILQRVAFNYGQIQTSGRAFARDLREFATAGIPIYKELAAVMGVTQQEVNDLISVGKVGGDEVKEAFARMTGEGGQFYRLMERASETFEGRLSTTIDAVKLTAAEIGEDLLPAAHDFLKWAQDTLGAIVEWNKETDGGVIRLGKWALAIAGAAKVVHLLTAAITLLKSAAPVLLALSASIAGGYLIYSKISTRSQEAVERSHERINAMYREQIRTTDDVVAAVQRISEKTGESAENVLNLVENIREVSESERDAILALEDASKHDKSAEQRFLLAGQKVRDLAREAEGYSYISTSIADKWDEIVNKHFSGAREYTAEAHEDLLLMLLGQKNISDELRAHVKLQQESLQAQRESLEVQRALNDVSGLRKEQRELVQFNQPTEAEEAASAAATEQDPVIKARLTAEAEYYNAIAVLQARLSDGDLTRADYLRDTLSVTEQYRSVLYDLGYTEELRNETTKELYKGSQALVQTAGELLAIERDLLALELGAPYEQAQQSLENYTALAEEAQVKLAALRSLENTEGSFGEQEQQALENQIDLQEYILEQARERITAAQELLGITSETTDELAEQHKNYASLSSLVHTTGSQYDGFVSSILGGLDAFYKFDEETGEMIKNTESTWQDKVAGIAQIAGAASSTVMGLVTQAFDQQMAETQARLAAMKEEIDEEKNAQEDRIAVLDALGQDSVAWQLENNKKIRESEDKLKEERKAAELENFNIKKNSALANAIVQGALAFTTALTSGPPPLNFILAGGVALAAGAQIGIIANQKPPKLAAGGIVPAQPPYGGLYRVGEQQAEAVIPLDKFGLGNQGTTVVNNYYTYTTTVQGSVIESDVGKQLDSAITEVESKGGVANA